MACSRSMYEMRETGATSLQSVIWEYLQSRDCTLLTTGENLCEEKVQALTRLNGTAGIGCRMAAFVSEQTPLVLDGDDGAIILEQPDWLTRDIIYVLSLAGYPRNYEAMGNSGPGFLKDARERIVLYPGMKHIGFVFSGISRDECRRPVLWATGSTPLGMLFAARWLAESPLASVKAPGCWPLEPLEVIITLAAPYINDTRGAPGARSGLGLNHLRARITCGDIEYDGVTGAWCPRQRPPKITLSQLGLNIIMITVNGVEICAGQGVKFDLLSVLVRSTQAGKWITLEEALTELDGCSSKGAYSEKRVAAVRARLADIRKLDLRLLQSRDRDGVREYRIAADIDVIKL